MHALPSRRRRDLAVVRQIVEVVWAQRPLKARAQRFRA
jgi:hypothetical protein